MAKFKCIHTGNEFTFNDSDSIEMRKHDEYLEVIAEEVILIVEPIVKVSSSKKQPTIKE